MPYATHDSETHFNDFIAHEQKKYSTDSDLCDLMQTMKLDASCEKGVRIEHRRRFTSSLSHGLSTKHSRRSHVRLSEPQFRRRVEVRRVRYEPRALLRLRLSTSNPISVRGLSHYRRGISRRDSHSPRNPSLLSRRASRLRTRLQ